jgi:hypothetical protein
MRLFWVLVKKASRSSTVTPSGSHAHLPSKNGAQNEVLLSGTHDPSDASAEDMISSRTTNAHEMLGIVGLSHVDDFLIEQRRFQEFLKKTMTSL